MQYTPLDAVLCAPSCTVSSHMIKPHNIASNCKASKDTALVQALQKRSRQALTLHLLLRLPFSTAAALPAAAC
jgi:hypothetical protein